MKTNWRKNVKPFGLVLLLLTKSAELKICAVSEYSKGNAKVMGHVIKSEPSTCPKQCMDICFRTENCNSINFNILTGLCELNSANHLSNPDDMMYSNDMMYMNYIPRRVRKCSRKLCSNGLVCVVEENGIEYNCRLCKDAPGYQEVLIFPRKSVSDKVLLENFFETALTKYTVSLWAQGSQAIEVYMFGFATPAYHNEIGLALTPTRFNVIFKELWPVIKVTFSHQSKWHHYLITWENVGGRLNAYIDGVLKGTRYLRIGTTVAKGALTLGQDQDKYKGGLEQSQSFQGNITSVNMWDRVITAEEIKALAQSCTSGGDGNILKWSDLKDKGEGEVTQFCSDACVFTP